MPIWIFNEEQPPPTPGSPQAVSLPTIRPMGVVTRVSLGSTQRLKAPHLLPPSQKVPGLTAAWSEKERAQKKQKRDGKVVPGCQPAVQRHPSCAVFTSCCTLPAPPDPVYTMVAAHHASTASLALTTWLADPKTPVTDGHCPSQSRAAG